MLSVAEFLKLQSPKAGRHELHHGEVVVTPPHKKGHQKIQDRILVLLKQRFGESGVVRMEMAFRPTPDHEVWQADVGFISLERDNATPDDEYLSGAPDLVAEVLSPSNTADEINDRLLICTNNGCVSFWVVDPKHRLASVTEGKMTKHYWNPILFRAICFRRVLQYRKYSINPVLSRLVPRELAVYCRCDL